MLDCRSLLVSSVVPCSEARCSRQYCALSMRAELLSAEEEAVTGRDIDDLRLAPAALNQCYEISHDDTRTNEIR